MLFKKRFAAFFSVLALFGCVVSCSYLKKQVFQFKLSRLKDTRADKVFFLPPPLPYNEEASQKLDKLWKNTEDQSSISYFSSCTKINENLSLQEIQQNVLSGLPEWKLLNTESSSHFLKSRFQVIGADYKTINSIYIFKNKNCFFVLNFVAGNKRIFEKNEQLFKGFIKGFKAL